jgi:hypothetical protein
MRSTVRVGAPLQLLVVVGSGKDGQREGSDGDAKRQQRRDGMADMGGALVWWPASVTKPLAAEGAGQQELTAGDEQGNGVLHAGMLADPRPWLADGGS